MGCRTCRSPCPGATSCQARALVCLISQTLVLPDGEPWSAAGATWGRRRRRLPYVAPARIALLSRPGDPPASGRRGVARRLLSWRSSDSPLCWKRCITINATISVRHRARRRAGVFVHGFYFTTLRDCSSTHLNSPGRVECPPRWRSSPGDVACDKQHCGSVSPGVIGPIILPPLPILCFSLIITKLSRRGACGSIIRK